MCSSYKESRGPKKMFLGTHFWIILGHVHHRVTYTMNNGNENCPFWYLSLWRALWSEHFGLECQSEAPFTGTFVPFIPFGEPRPKIYLAALYFNVLNKSVMLYCFQNV